MATLTGTEMQELDPYALLPVLGKPDTEVVWQAASVLERAGHRDTVAVTGGPGDWAATGEVALETGG